jgi:parallel beta-helix repeat protein
MRAAFLGSTVVAFLAVISARAGAATSIPFATMPSSFMWAPCSPTPAVPTGGKKYYVSPNGSDSATGLSFSTPFKTIGRVLNNNLLSPGDTLLIAAGTYNEVVEVKKGGSPGACITVMGMPGQARPLITWSTDAYPTVNVWAPYVRLSGLSVTHPEPNLNPKSTSNSGNSAIDVYSAGAFDSSGVFRPTVHHVQLDNNEAFGAGCGGISFEGTDYVLIYGNTVHGNAYSQSGHCSGISIYEPLNRDNGTGYHNYVIDNYTYGNANIYSVPGPAYTTDESGIIIDDSRQLQRKIRNPNLNVQAYTGRTLIFGNVAYGNGGRAINVYSSDHVDVFNNVGYKDLTDHELKNYPNSGGELFVDYSGSVRLVNNIVVTSAPDLYVLFQVGAPADQASNLWTRDISDVGKISLGQPNSGNATAASLYGVNPKFLNPSAISSAPTWAFRLGANSPARGAGAPLSTTVTDITGVTVAAGHSINIGAYLQ